MGTCPPENPEYESQFVRKEVKMSGIKTGRHVCHFRSVSVYQFTKSSFIRDFVSFLLVRMDQSGNLLCNSRRNQMKVYVSRCTSTDISL